MTEENYQYRTSPFLLRNQFSGPGVWKMPVIPKAELEPSLFDNLLLIGFDRTKADAAVCLDRIVHFFLYDYKFERVWKEPDRDIERLRQYPAVLSPDFSMYLEMSPVVQLHNTFRNRWCGAYFASKGIPVIPTVSWGDESTFDFCFEGIPKGSTVAVSTYMVSAHGSRADQKEFFLKGYNELLRRVEPERIICYNTPFPEMQGHIIPVDYELSSWKYQNDAYTPSPYAPYILGEKALTPDVGIVVKRGYILDDDLWEKGIGSAFGGEWRPKDEDAERFLGEPGIIKITYTKHGEKRATKIGKDGRATKERHFTDHNQPWAHNGTHDHLIDWNNPDGHPHLGSPINYPDGAPEFKAYGGIKMSKNAPTDISEYDHFESISDFKQCMRYHGEVLFQYGNQSFSITFTDDGQIRISESFRQETERICKDADEVMEYLVDGVRLRDIITQVDVLARYM